MATVSARPASARAGIDLVDVVLLIVAASQLLPGILALVAPGAFYDAFAAFPPENSHFIRDVGSWQVALGLVAVLAWRRPALRAPVLAILAVQYGLHLISHIVDVNASDPEWHGVFGVAAEALGTVVLTALAIKESRILLAGATGAIGRPLVRRLVDAGHEVVALTRRPDKVAELDQAGARGVVCDVCDRQALFAIAAETKPDVVIDETTDLPQRYDGRKMHGFYDGMAPLRLIGTPNLMEAAYEHEARLIFQSIAFAYRPEPHRPGTEQRLRTEDDAIFGFDGPEPWNWAMPVIGALEQRAVGYGGLVLRYGMFYGPHTHFTPGAQMYEEIRRRRMPIPGAGTGVCSFIHVDDAAAATVRALEQPDVRGILNVTDDEPMPIADWVPLFAEVIGAPKPLRVPRTIAKLATGPLPFHFATTMPGTSNARAKEQLSWAPTYPSVREGFRAEPTRLDRMEYSA